MVYIYFFVFPFYGTVEPVKNEEVFICEAVVISLPTISESCVNWFYKCGIEK